MRHICKSQFRRLFGHGVKAGRHFVSDLRSLLRGGALTATEAHLLHDGAHFRAADILRGVNWRNREITAFHARTMAFVAAFIFGKEFGRLQYRPIATCEPEIDAPADVVEQGIQVRLKQGRYRRYRSRFAGGLPRFAMERGSQS